MGELQIPTKIVDLGLLLLLLLGFAVSMLLTFCHRNPVRNDARGCAPSIARDARVSQFCKQPRDVRGKVRDEPDPPWNFCGRRMRKNGQKIARTAAASSQLVVGAMRRKWRTRSAACAASTAAGQHAIPVASCAAIPRRP